MLKSDPVQGIYLIKGNQPLLLTDPKTLWVLRSGSMALFASRIEEGMPVGSRRYLFNVSAGDALFGAELVPGSSSPEQRSFLAVAIEETELCQLPITDLVAQVAAAEPKAIALLEGWVDYLGQTISTPQAALTWSENVVQAEGSHYLSLLKDQVLQPLKGMVAWVKLQQGSARWMGVENLTLESATPVFPLAGAMWLEAEKPVEVHTTPTAELENVEQLPASLAGLHAYFFRYLDLLEQQEAEAEFQRFQEREQLNRSLAEGALGELAAVLQPQQEVSFYQEGTPTLMAAGAVGRAMGIRILPPAKSEDSRRVRDPLEPIARASQIRTRLVLLEEGWWRKDYGPLLGYNQEDNRPVALLPTQGSRYVLYDPVEQTRTPVNEAVAATLNLEAQMFYRPLPVVIARATELFRFGIKHHEKDLIAIVVAGIIGTLLGMVTPQATAILVNDAIPDSDRVLLWQIGLALFAVAFGQSAFQMAQGIITLRVETAADSVLQPATWDRLLRLSPAFFRKYFSGDLVNRVMSISQIRSKLSGATQRTLLSGVFALLNGVLMFAYSWQLALVGVSLAFLGAVVTSISSLLVVRKSRTEQEIDGAIYGLAVELINGVAKLRVAMAEERAFAAWAKKYSIRSRLKARIQRIDDSVSVFNEALPMVTSVLLYWFAIVFIQMGEANAGKGALTAGSFLAFNSAFGTFIHGVTDLSNTLTDILGIVPMWERAQPILYAEPESDPNKADPGRLTGRIDLDHVTFRYREDGPLILDDVSLYVNPGEFVAVVGPSGSGKSTIFRLLLGFDIPASGTVYYDGQDLAGLDIQAVRRQLGVVLQNGRIGAGPIFDSITAGALVSLDEAWEAARMAGFAEDIERMPMGMHTVVSEGGTNLSGGQRQRLLIARALVLKPKIILMDEATSALDNRTQAIVSESLDKLNASRVVIAHRLSTIRNADRIYVVEAGRVVQAGPFEELVKEPGLFARLAARQLE